MDVFLRNVPLDLAEGSLRKELKPVMNVLGVVDWDCSKSRRKNFAFVSFLQLADGERFLAKHGAVAAAAAPPPDPSSAAATFKSLPFLGARPRQLARLHILSLPVYASRSRRPIDRQTLSALERDHDVRQQQQQQQQQQRGAGAASVRCPLLDVACGKMVFAGPSGADLVFAHQTGLRARAQLRFGRRNLSAVFDDDGDRMDVPYDILVDLVADHATKALTLVLSEPPRFYARLPEPPDPRRGGHVRWERVAALPRWADHDRYVAHCLVYQLWLGPAHDEAVRSLRQLDLVAVSRHRVLLEPRPEPFVHDYGTAVGRFNGRIQSPDVNRLVPFALLFQVQLLVWNNYLHPSGALAVLDVLERAAKTTEATAATATAAKRDFPFKADSMKLLLPKIPYPVPGTEPASLDPTRLMETAARLEMERYREDLHRRGVYGPPLPGHQTWVFKAMVTPTRILLQGPDAESKNRVLRMFPDHGDHFLRVSFCDEDGQDLPFNPKVSNEAALERYRRVLRDGIHIAGRRFSFLGFSHSSLRSHSTWFLAPFVDGDMRRHDYDSILRSLGDFSEIRSAARCAARIGQAFSETPYAVDLVRSRILSRSIPDVKSDDGARVFSDGVGTISPEALDEVWAALPPRAAAAAPTCVQIRWGGVKGMLSLDARLRGRLICVRDESMMKFPSRDRRELGICDAASRPLRMYLNRQLIKILEDMGTRDSWFLALQNRALAAIRSATANAANTATFLRWQDVGAAALGLPALVRRLDRMGIDYRRDDFLRSVVEHVVLRELRLLKHKARIPVDRAVTLFGVMDETGFLAEGEVYVSYDRARLHRRRRGGGDGDEYVDDDDVDDAASLPDDGPVLVTRCPALHPGDVQEARMRTPPPGHPLRELRNCVVFSRRGARDLPSQLSGGDLDGDLYGVVWDARAAPARTFEPADYPRVAPPVLDRAVGPDDIADFFIQFMRTDILGLIANRHLILADVQDGGTCDPKCVQLAEMHSTAVDFSKTGIPVEPHNMPKAPRTRPDFLAPAPPVKLYDLGQIDYLDEPERADEDDDGMGSARHRYHRSAKILGRLYRGVDEKKIWDRDIHRAVNTDGPSVWDQFTGRMQAELEGLGIALDYARHADDARKLRHLYEEAMSGSMWHFSTNPRESLTEVEVFCGSLLNKRGAQTRQQRDNSTRLKDEADRIQSWMVNLMRRRGGRVEPDSGAESGPDADEPRDDVVQLCWACLVVGCLKDADDGADGGSARRSFRVCAAACLLKEVDALRGAVAGGGFVGVAAGLARRLDGLALG